MSDSEDIESLVSGEEVEDTESTGAVPIPALNIDAPALGDGSTADKDGGEGDTVDEEEEEEEEEEDEAMIRLENDVDQDYLLEFHPEVAQANFSEILAQAVVVRAKNGDVVDPLHKTLPVLSRYERARVLGLRSKQLNNGADPFVEVPADMIDGYAIAQEELKQKKVPFIIRRPLPNGASEYWRVSDLELIDY